MSNFPNNAFRDRDQGGAGSAFSLEHYDLVTKATLYQICDGQRDMKLSTLRGLAAALRMSPDRLIAGL